MIRKTIPGDKESILKIIQESGEFDSDGLAYVEATLDAHLSDGSDSLWLTADDGEPNMFVRLLRHQAGVTVTPGTEFAPGYSDSIRLNFSQDHVAAVTAA